jgi:hypothetical protein
MIKNILEFLSMRGMYLDDWAACAGVCRHWNKSIERAIDVSRQLEMVVRHWNPKRIMTANVRILTVDLFCDLEIKDMNLKIPSDGEQMSSLRSLTIRMNSLHPWSDYRRQVKRFIIHCVSKAPCLETLQFKYDENKNFIGNADMKTPVILPPTIFGSRLLRSISSSCLRSLSCIVNDPSVLAKQLFNANEVSEVMSGLTTFRAQCCGAKPLADMMEIGAVLGKRMPKLRSLELSRCHDQIGQLTRFAMPWKDTLCHLDLSTRVNARRSVQQPFDLTDLHQFSRLESLNLNGVSRIGYYEFFDILRYRPPSLKAIGVVCDALRIPPLTPRPSDPIKFDVARVQGVFDEVKKQAMEPLEILVLPARWNVAVTMLFRNNVARCINLHNIGVKADNDDDELKSMMDAELVKYLQDAAVRQYATTGVKINPYNDQVDEVMEIAPSILQEFVNVTFQSVRTTLPAMRKDYWSFCECNHPPTPDRRCGVCPINYLKKLYPHMDNDGHQASVVDIS